MKSPKRKPDYSVLILTVPRPISVYSYNNLSANRDISILALHLLREIQAERKTT